MIETNELVFVSILTHERSSKSATRTDDYDFHLGEAVSFPYSSYNFRYNFIRWSQIATQIQFLEAYGTDVPTRDFMIVTSEALMVPLAFTSRRKFDAVSGCPNCCLA